MDFVMYKYYAISLKVYAMQQKIMQLLEENQRNKNIKLKKPECKHRVYHGKVHTELI